MLQQIKTAEAYTSAVILYGYFLALEKFAASVTDGEKQTAQNPSGRIGQRGQKKRLTEIVFCNEQICLTEQNKTAKHDHHGSVCISHAAQCTGINLIEADHDVER